MLTGEGGGVISAIWGHFSKRPPPHLLLTLFGYVILVFFILYFYTTHICCNAVRMHYFGSNIFTVLSVFNYYSSQDHAFFGTVRTGGGGGGWIPLPLRFC